MGRSQKARYVRGEVSQCPSESLIYERFGKKSLLGLYVPANASLPWSVSLATPGP